MKNFYKFKIIILCFSLYFFKDTDSLEKKFILDKECTFYKIENEKLIKIPIGKNELKDLNSKNFEAKEIKKIKKSEYIELKNNENQFNISDDVYVNKNCGYFLIENEKNHIKFQERFLKKDEINQIEKGIKEIDNQILNLCGELGSHPKKEKFLEITKKYQNEFNSIYKEISGQFPGKKISFEDFINQISDVLFKNQCFNHVFCGILKKDKIAGPHYAPRFLDLDKKKLIGFSSALQNESNKKTNNKFFDLKKDLSNEKVFIKRSMSFLNHEEQIKIKSENSFIINDNFLDLIKLIGKICYFELKILKLDNNNLKKTKNIKSCILEENDRFYKIVFNSENHSLITLYPILEYKKKDACI
jgi:hypothetical protein